MANSLLAHLYSRIKGSQEDIATFALQYLLSQSKELNRDFTKQVSDSFRIDLEDNLQYTCQSVGENLERPDMVGTNKSGQELVLFEMKFYAGLTQNQPLGYIDRLKKNGGKGLVFICPQARQTVLWSKCRTEYRTYQRPLSLCRWRLYDDSYLGRSNRKP